MSMIWLSWVAVVPVWSPCTMTTSASNYCHFPHSMDTSSWSHTMLSGASNLASFQGLPPPVFVLRFVFGIIHRSGRVAKKKQGRSGNTYHLNDLRRMWGRHREGVFDPLDQLAWLGFAGSTRVPVQSNLASYPGHSFINKKRPGNLSEFKLLTSAALELAVPIRFQNASRESCGISFAW